MTVYESVSVTLQFFPATIGMITMVMMALQSGSQK